MTDGQSNFEFDENHSIRTGELTRRVLAHFGCTGETYSGGQKFIGLTQLRADAGWDVQTGDVVIMGAWGSTNHNIQGFEVKISRSDWLNEVKKQGKNDEIKQYCDRFWLVIADEKMVKDGELPDDWGMMIVSGTGLKVVKQAPRLDPKPVTKGFVAMMLRSNQSDVIPADVHADTVKDIKREYEKQFKEYYSSSVQFIKDIKKELGINIEHSDYGDKKWYATVANWRITKELGQGSHHLSAKKLAAIVKIVLNRDLDNIRWQLESAVGSAESIIKIAKEFKKDEEN